MYFTNCIITYNNNNYKAELIEQQMNDTQFNSHLVPNYTLITNIFMPDDAVFTDEKNRMFKVLKNIKTPYFYYYEVALL